MLSLKEIYDGVVKETERLLQICVELARENDVLQKGTRSETLTKSEARKQIASHTPYYLDRGGRGRGIAGRGAKYNYHGGRGGIQSNTKPQPQLYGDELKIFPKQKNTPHNGGNVRHWEGN